MADTEFDSHCAGGDNPGDIGFHVVQVDSHVVPLDLHKPNTVAPFKDKIESFLHQNPHLRSRALNLGHDMVARVTGSGKEIIIASGIAGAVTAGAIIGIIMHEHNKKHDDSSHPH